MVLSVRSTYDMIYTVPPTICRRMEYIHMSSIASFLDVMILASITETSGDQILAGIGKEYPLFLWAILD